MNIPVRDSVRDLPAYTPGVLVPGKIKLASNENPLGPSPKAIEAVRAHLSGSQLYPDGAAIELRAAIASHRGVDASMVIVGNGSDEVLSLAAATFVASGDEVLIADHTFSVYSSVSRLFEGRPRVVALRDGRFDLGAISDAIGPKTRAVFLCSPNNPTGTIIETAALAPFLDRIDSRILVVLDEAYAEFVDSPQYPDGLALVRRHPNLLVTRTFSKIYGLAGLRVGYGIAQAALIQSMEKVRPPFNVNSMAQIAAAAALDDTEFFERSRGLAVEGRRFLEAEFDRRRLSYFPSQANFICVETGRDSKAMYNAILGGGVTIRPLASFGLPTSIRVTVGSAEQNAVFLAALDRALALVPAAEMASSRI